MIPIERIQAAVNLLYPDDMTPSAKRVFDSIIEDEKRLEKFRRNNNEQMENG